MSVIHGRHLSGDIDRPCDVCIVGSGAGGATLAAGLCAKGLDVVMLEAGGYQRPSDFDLRESTAYPLMYQDRALRSTADGAMVVLQGKTVGGSTTINWTTCFRTPDWVLNHWVSEYGWQTSLEELGPHFEAMEARLGITTWPEALANGQNQVLARGARSLGWQVEPLRRNVRGCINSGYCGVGCAWDAKQSMLATTIPDAVAAGLTLIADAPAHEIERAGNRAIAVHGQAVRGNGRPNGHSIRILPKTVVVAGGAINSPALLLKSGINPRGLVGKRTFCHPTIAVNGIYPDSIEGWSGAPQSMACHEWVDRGSEMGFFLECSPLQPVLAGTAMGGFGQEQLTFMQQLPHVAPLIALMVEGFHADAPGGIVTLGKDGRPKLAYPFGPLVQKGFKAAHHALAQLHLAAGAQEVHTLHLDGAAIRSEAELTALDQRDYGAHAHQIFTAHQMGGCPMGADPNRSVVDLEYRVRGTDNIFVVDGSLFPTCAAVNPSETIYALAHRAIDFVG